MIAFPHAKINLGLSIVKKRPDGFHDLETIFYPLPLRDSLEIMHSSENRFTSSGLSIPGEAKDNLILRAFQVLNQKFPRITPLDIHLLKAIPPGAGLGGGSSDAAAMIQLMQQYFDLQLPREELFEMALNLGSDCPFFMQSSPCFASGRGEILEPVSLDLSGYSFLLVHPETRINTAWAYSQIKPAVPRSDLKKIILEPVEEWRRFLQNDFEIPVFAKFPFLRQCKEQLYAAGAQYAAMTGSGSTIFGIFEKGNMPEMKLESARVTYIL